jgi:N-acetyl-alpha-D-glucosaminyl L-malate synthase BshA
VLHAHYAVPFGVVALLARQLSARSPRIVTTLHGTDITILGRDARYREIVRHCIEGSDAVTAVSKPLIDDAAGLVGAKKTIHLVPNFPISRRMSGSRAALRSEIDVGPDDFLLLHMSNLRPLKRVADILGALARCRTDPKLMILAGGDVQECETTAEKLGVSDSLRVHSRVAEVEPYIGISDAGVYASESEQCSLAILETMSFAKPVIASNSGGTPEVIGETGLLFEVGDVDALAGHIDFLVTNPERCRELGLAARQRTERAFPRDVIVNRYLELYSG